MRTVDDDITNLTTVDICFALRAAMPLPLGLPTLESLVLSYKAFNSKEMHADKLDKFKPSIQ